MKSIVKYGAILVLISIVGIFGWVWYGMSRTSCKDVLLSEEKSIDGNYVIGVFEGNCGATTDYIGHINYRKVDSSFTKDRSGMVVENQICGSSGRIRFDIVWESKNKLVVKSDKKLDQLKCIDKFDDINVEVQQMN